MATTIKQYLKHISTPCQAEHWGFISTITPAIVDKYIGDGMQIIAMAPLATRPNFYVVRIDSSIDIENDEWDCDSAYTMITDQYPEYDRNDGSCLFPEVDFSCGTSWWLLAKFDKSGKLIK